MNNIEFLGAEHLWQDGATRYWFRMDGERYAVVESESAAGVVDADGCSIEGNAQWERTSARLLAAVTDDVRARAAGL